MVLTGRFFFFLALGFLPVLAGAFDGRWFWFGLAYDAGLLGTALGEFLLLRARRREVVLKRIVPGVVSIGVPFEVTVEVENRSHGPLRLRVKDSPPIGLEVSNRELCFAVRPASKECRAYTTRADARGTFAFGRLDYRRRGATGLCEYQGRLSLSDTVRVYPNVKMLSQVELAIAHSSRRQYGLRTARMAGEGREFESLRRYVRDDDYRWIDWKATARRSELISRQYQSERNQRLLILLDSGRLMAPKVGAFAKLDYAVNAAAMLCHVGLLQGDLVGLQVFSNEVTAYHPPERGRDQLVRLVDTLFHVQPRRFESDYGLAFAQVARRNSRRTLMVCFTDLVDEQASRLLIQNLLRLLPKHLPMCVTVSDSDLLAARQQHPRTVEDVFEKVAAMEVWEDYRRALGLLEGRGVAVVNVPAAELTMATVNRYLEIKSRGRL